MIKLLAIDTSTDNCSVALCCGEQFFTRSVVAPKQHTKLVLQQIAEVLAAAKISLTDLTALAFGYGPGSFTGIRLAAGVVQGLAFGLALPVVQVSTLQALAQQVWEQEHCSKVIVAQDARMREWYYGRYCLDEKTLIMRPEIADQLLAQTELNKLILPGWCGVGSAYLQLAETLPRNFKHFALQYIEARYVAQLAVYAYQAGEAIAAADALPLYLRDQVTT